MKLIVIAGLVLFILLIHLLRKNIPKFKITFLRLALLCSFSILITYFAWKLIVIVGIVSLSAAVISPVFKIKAK